MESCRQLPDDVLDMLAQLKPSPRLIAHLTLVYDTVWNLTALMKESFPLLNFDRDVVLYGAAIHDIGKTVIPAELSEPGSLHEELGFQLLCKKGIDKKISLIARDHSNWNTNTQIETLLVSVADKIWKGKRVPELEELLLKKILTDDGEDHWTVFIALDEILEQLASHAEGRLAYHASCPL